MNNLDYLESFKDIFKILQDNQVIKIYEFQVDVYVYVLSRYTANPAIINHVHYVVQNQKALLGTTASI